MIFEILSLSFLILFLFLINFILVKSNLLIHSNSNEEHKKFGLDQIPLSGGLFFFIVLLYLSIPQNYISNIIILFIFFYLFLGLLVDYGVEINPKLRLIIQTVLTLSMVFLCEIYINKTNLFFLDYFLDSIFFNIFFSSFCILVIINGLNFMDGVNNNVIGYCLLLLLSIIFIEHRNLSLQNIDFYNFLLIALLVFYLFNFFNQVYLGDAGIYILSVSFSIIVILFINKSNYVSPLLAINLLWYPAFETLFSMSRKLLSKQNPFKPDTKHFHTLLLKFLGHYKIKNKNTISGLLLNLALLPNFFIAINFYNNSKIILMTTIVYMLLYSLLYLKLSTLKR